jgi:hypothetical protein
MVARWSAPSEKNVRGQCTSLRQDAQSGHSFCVIRRRPECRRMRAFAVICPNHEHRPGSPFRLFSVSLRPPSLTQPNHGHFGTVVRSPPDQWVMRCQLGGGFESAALKRSEHGSNNSIRYGCRADRNRAPRGVAGADRRGARLGPSRERPPAEGPLCRASMGPSAGRLRRLVVHRSCEASRGVGHSASCCGLPMCATGCAGMQSAVEAAGGSSYEQPSER